MEYTLPVYADGEPGNEVDRTTVNLSQEQIQSLLDELVLCFDGNGDIDGVRRVCQEMNIINNPEVV